MAVEIDVIYEGALHCKATHGPSGTTLLTDAPTDNGGQGAYFSPTDLVVTAAAACPLTIMGLVAKEHGLAIEGTKVRAVKEMVADPDRRIGAIRLEVTLPGHFDETARRRLENAAKTCPVAKSLHPDVIFDLQFTYTD